ncbi:MAG TPA: hypothetical protein VF736_13670 [Pyrinomonadaceae bacterium]|jgi:hypothetical protein
MAETRVQSAAADAGADGGGPEGRDARAELADAFMDVITRGIREGGPEKLPAFVDMGVKVLEAVNASSARQQARAQRRQAGMVFGTLLATAFAAGGTAVGLSSRGPALLCVLLLCIGAACAGATFALILADDPRPAAPPAAEAVAPPPLTGADAAARLAAEADPAATAERAARPAGRKEGEA